LEGKKGKKREWVYFPHTSMNEKIFSKISLTECYHTHCCLCLFIYWASAFARL